VANKRNWRQFTTNPCCYVRDQIKCGKPFDVQLSTPVLYKHASKVQRHPHTQVALEAQSNTAGFCRRHRHSAPQAKVWFRWVDIIQSEVAFKRKREPTIRYRRAENLKRIDETYLVGFNLANTSLSARFSVGYFTKLQFYPRFCTGVNQPDALREENKLTTFRNEVIWIC
jgi:hypothetical protein